MDTVEFIKMEEREEMVRRLLQEKLNLTLEKIAEIANVPVKIVRDIKSELGIR